TGRHARALEAPPRAPHARRADARWPPRARPARSPPPRRLYRPRYPWSMEPTSAETRSWALFTVFFMVDRAHRVGGARGHRLHHPRMDLPDLPRPVHRHDPVGVAPGELLVGGRDGALELDPGALEAIGAIGFAGREPLLAAPLGLVGVDPQEHGHVRHALAHDNLVEALHVLDPEPSGAALVGGGRVDEPIADHVAAGFYRRPDHLAAQGRARGREQEQLHRGPQLERRIEEQLAHPLADRRPAGLAEKQGVGSERAGEERRLGRLARPVDALERDEHAPLTAWSGPRHRRAWCGASRRLAFGAGRSAAAARRPR